MPSSGDKVKAADVDDLGDYTIRKPLVRLVAQSAQSMPDNTATAVQFGASSEDIDTDGFHDTVTNNTRVTPTVAGYYRVHGTVHMVVPTTPVVTSVWIRKTGATNMPPAGRGQPGAPAYSYSSTALVSLNGSTDYVELMVQQDSAGALNSNNSSQFASVLEVSFERPL